MQQIRPRGAKSRVERGRNNETTLAEFLFPSFSHPHHVSATIKPTATKTCSVSNINESRLYYACILLY